VAMEMARQLAADGQVVRGVVLLDTRTAVRTRQERHGAGDLRRVVRRRLKPEWKALRSRVEVRGRASGVLPTRTPEARVRWVIESQRVAHRAYERRSYDGAVVVFRAASMWSSEPTLGWQRHVSGAIEVHDVQGEHTGLLSPDWASATATSVGRCLLRLTGVEGDHHAPLVDGRPLRAQPVT
jgi:thioesterase domain-containing protein